MSFYPELKYEILERSEYSNKQEKLNFIARNILALKESLGEQIPSKSRNNTLLISTFNIREFDSNRKKMGFRTLESLYYLAEIISSFDIIALQEVSHDLSSFKKLMNILGKEYEYFLTDVTEGTSGNGERMAYIFDQKKVQFRNIAGEIVMPGTLNKPVAQFARTPYLVAFQAGWCKFNLCTVHIYYGKDTGKQYEQRVEEIRKISQFFKKRSVTDPDENFILLGDFNIPNYESDAMDALKSGGFKIPEALQKRSGSNIKKDKMYDQIVFREGKNKIRFSGRAGVFDYYNTVFDTAHMEAYYEDYKLAMKSNKKTASKEKFKKDFNEWKTYQMSDHLPLWVELEIDYSKEYLEALISE